MKKVYIEIEYDDERNSVSELDIAAMAADGISERIDGCVNYDTLSVDALKSLLSNITKEGLERYSEAQGVAYKEWVEKNIKMLPAYSRYKKLIEGIDNHD